MSATAFPRWALAVDLVVSALSVLGGLAIVVGYLCAPQKQHLRMKLILGLGVTGASFSPCKWTSCGPGSLTFPPQRRHNCRQTLCRR
mgnify:CR=1 FL=1|jgi:hypothetical protein